ncbi:hypothetical protein [Stenotrophomonas sp.]|uniref:hypothetical protein n=1 Tax=Stenotrophomonas sp. TaxID=69392 RepID=UPI0028ABF376|nr:hypothetical protein [Stenotrophomonas sp.]
MPPKANKSAAKKVAEKPQAKKGAGGRPTKYKAEFAKQAKFLADKGCTDPEVAAFFEVALSTVSLWKLKHPEFSEALRLGKAEADGRVERALFERATGYSHADTHVSSYLGEVTLTPVMKHYPPDSTAMIFWLKNRKPEHWRDKPEGFNDDAPPPAAVTVTVVSGRKRANPQ